MNNENVLDRKNKQKYSSINYSQGNRIKNFIHELHELTRILYYTISPEVKLDRERYNMNKFSAKLKI